MKLGSQKAKERIDQQQEVLKNVLFKRNSLDLGPGLHLLNTSHRPGRLCIRSLCSKGNQSNNSGFLQDQSPTKAGSLLQPRIGGLLTILLLNSCKKSSYPRRHHVTLKSPIYLYQTAIGVMRLRSLYGNTSKTISICCFYYYILRMYFNHWIYQYSLL